LTSAEGLVLPKTFEFSSLRTGRKIQVELIKNMSIEQLQDLETNNESLDKLVKKTLFKKIYGC
jgi:cell division protein YceG involved in septum cleavage